MTDKHAAPSPLASISPAELMLADIRRLRRLCELLKAEVERLTAAARLVAQPRYAAKRASNADLDQLCSKIERLANLSAPGNVAAELAITMAKLDALERTARTLCRGEAFQLH